MYVLAVRTTLYNIFFLKQLLIKHRYIYIHNVFEAIAHSKKKKVELKWLKLQLLPKVVDGHLMVWLLSSLVALVELGTIHFKF